VPLWLWWRKWLVTFGTPLLALGGVTNTFRFNLDLRPSYGVVKYQDSFLITTYVYGSIRALAQLPACLSMVTPFFILIPTPHQSIVIARILLPLFSLGTPLLDKRFSHLAVFWSDFDADMHV
jgi:hypothetical protein